MGWYTQYGILASDTKGSKMPLLRRFGVVDGPVSVVKESYKNQFYSAVFVDLVSGNADAIHVLMLIEPSRERGYVDIDIKRLSISNDTFPKSYRKWLVDQGVNITEW